MTDNSHELTEALFKKLKHASLSGANAAAFKALAEATLKQGKSPIVPIREVDEDDPLFLSDPTAAKLRMCASTVNLGHLKKQRKARRGLVVLCRICEEEVLAASLEDHTAFCAIANNADYTTASLDDKLNMLKAALQFRTRYMDQVREEAGAEGKMSQVEERLRSAMYNVMTILDSIIGVLAFDLNALDELEELRRDLDKAAPVGSTEHTVLKEVLSTARQYLDMKIVTVREGQKAKTGARKSAARPHDKSKGYYEELQALTEKQKQRLGSAGIARDSGSSTGSSISLASRRPISAKVSPFSLSDFDILNPISRGAYGQVILAKKKTTSDLYAIKIIPKSQGQERRKQVRQVMVERNILKESMSTFIVKYYSSFESPKNLYMVMEYVPGGDLLALLLRNEVLPESWAKLYIAELVLALEWLHKQGIIHRDLKPDNILLTESGHIRLTDFGLSEYGLSQKTKDISDQASERLREGLSTSYRDRSAFMEKGSIAKRRELQQQENTPVGTPDYVAPEALLGQEHGPALDWWSTGIILFELVTGIPPFNDDAPELIFNNILSMEMWWPEVPEEMSHECKDLISKLLAFDPKYRLGANGAQEVKAHPFFSDIDWKALARGKMQMPWIPEHISHEDVSLFDRGRSHFAISISEQEMQGHLENSPSTIQVDVSGEVPLPATPYDMRLSRVYDNPESILEPVKVVHPTPSMSRAFEDVSIDALAHKNQHLAGQVNGDSMDRRKLRQDLLRPAARHSPVITRVAAQNEPGSSPDFSVRQALHQSAPNLLAIQQLTKRHSRSILDSSVEGSLTTGESSVLPELDEDAIRAFFTRGPSAAEIANGVEGATSNAPEIKRVGFFEELDAKMSKGVSSTTDERRTSAPTSLNKMSLGDGHIADTSEPNTVRAFASSEAVLGQMALLNTSADTSINETEGTLAPVREEDHETDPNLDPDYVRIE